jgi:hypothetical protein
MRSIAALPNRAIAPGAASAAADPRRSAAAARGPQAPRVGAIAIPVARIIGRPEAVPIPVGVDVGIAVRVAVSVSFFEADVVTEVVIATCASGMTGGMGVACLIWIAAAAGTAVATGRAVAGRRCGGDEPSVLARAPAAGRAPKDGPVRRQQAEQGKQQASHAIHLLVGSS